MLYPFAAGWCSAIALVAMLSGHLLVAVGFAVWAGLNVALCCGLFGRGSKGEKEVPRDR